MRSLCIPITKPMGRTLPSILVCLVVTGLIVTGCARNPVTGQQDLVLMSEETELGLGREYNAEVLKTYREYDNRALSGYVQQIGERLANNSHRSNLVYRFTVLDSADVNAFALPGGYIYITRGILAYLGSEAELAAVLGHEIGHVTARHSVRQQSAQTLTGILGGILAAGSGVRGAGDLVNVLGTALVRGYGREYELEADRLGAEYLAKSGYDPNAMLRVIQQLKDQEAFEEQLAKEEGREPRIYHGLFATHPDNDQRLKEVVGAAGRFSTTGQTSNGRETYLRQIDGLVFGDSEQDGILRGNRFYHGPLGMTFAFPTGWRVENRPDRLVVQPPDGQASLLVTLEDLNRRISPRSFMQKRLKINNMSKGAAFNHNGLTGYTALARGSTPFGSRLTRYIVVYHEKRAYIFAGASKDDRKFGSYDRMFLATARSFRPLRAHEKQLAKPMHLRVITAKRGLTFKKMATTSKLSSRPEAQLRLLNGRYPSGEPVAGSVLKIVE